MKQGSIRPGIISVIIALIVHLIILALLFLAWCYHRAERLSHDDEQSEAIAPDYGAPGAQVIVYQPPTQSSSPSTAPLQSPPAVQSPPVHFELPEEPSVQEVVQEPIDAPMLETAPTSSDMLLQSALPVETQPTAPPVVSHPRRKKKKQKSSSGLQGLSIASLAHQTTSSLSYGNRGYTSDPHNTQDLIYRMYAGKIIQMLGNAINAEGVRLLLTRDVVRATTLFVSVKRDGKLVDVHFDPCTPELQKIELAIRTVAQQAGLYPKVPNTLKADPITIRIPLKVDGKSGMGDYHFTYGNY